MNDDGTGNVGSAAFMDASFTNVKQAIVIAPPSSEPGTGTTGLVLDNVAFSGVGQGVADTAGNTLVSGSYYVSSWVLGPLYNSTTRTWSSGTGQRQYRDADLTTRDEVGLPEAPYFERAKPQYVDSPVSDFIHLKDFATGALTPGPCVRQRLTKSQVTAPRTTQLGCRRRSIVPVTRLFTLTQVSTP